MNSDFTEEESQYAVNFSKFLMEDCSADNINSIIKWDKNQARMKENMEKYANSYVN